ncbi:EAL domain-containing protein [bacterium]|nr:EAL domain-containing protein [bacterium]MBU1990658.1 EAL domain-containing protein [bacterium]
MENFLNNPEEFKNLDILFVEDDDTLRAQSSVLFKKLFKSVATCTNGLQGLEAYAVGTYDIVITDINMPLMDGLEMSKEIKHLNHAQPILIISAYKEHQYFLQSIKIGVDGYILKPFSLEQLFESIRKIATGITAKKELKKYHDKLEQMLEEKTKEVVYKSFHDELTDTYNHFALTDLIKKSGELKILLLNIDNFRNINDAYGFDVGDHVLVEASKLLKIIQPVNSKLFRLNSDEFVFVIEDEISKRGLVEILNSIEYFFSESEISLDYNIDIKISFSIGVSAGKGISALNEAKVAIRELREHTCGTYKFFDKDSDFLHKQHNNLYWIHKIKDSIGIGSLIPFYQPIINNKTGEIDKYECLARIEEGDTLIPPIRFMEAAKVTGMLPVITRTIIQQSCEKFSDTHYQFSINITSEDLYMEYLEEFLLKNTKKYNIKPSRLVLEILENITSLNDDTTLKQLHSLRKKGFKISIDDFGSESSNFSRLLEFSPDYLKIDGSFIKNILDDEKTKIITEAIVYIAHKSNIKVIAEFVHNAEVQKLVKEIGVDFSQGYYFSEPKKDL